MNASRPQDFVRGTNQIKTEKKSIDNNGSVTIPPKKKK